MFNQVMAKAFACKRLKAPRRFQVVLRRQIRRSGHGFELPRAVRCRRSTQQVELLQIWWVEG